MPARFVIVDHDTPLLLPPDLRDWVPADHMVHFVMDAVRVINLSQAHVNARGTGDAQYPPSMMLSLLIYCYATGTFSSHKIEQLTYDSVPVRYLCADTHPDHDTICKFRRENKELLQSSFHQVLECAARAKVLKVGDITLAIDGTKIKANASKHSAMSYDHALKQMQLLEDEIAQLLAKAEEADSTPLRDGLSVPEEIKRREDRIGKIKQAVSVMEERAKERIARERAEYEEKLKARENKEKATGRKTGGRPPEPPKEGPKDKDQYNFTDPESRIMKAGSGEHFEQSYNAQAGVEIESRLIVTQRVSDSPNDKQELEATLAARSSVVESIDTALVDSGYYSEEAIRKVENSQQPALEGTTVLAATKRHRHGRSVADLEEQGEEPSAPAEGATMKEIMEHRLSTRAGKELYAQRKQTIEPVFGITKAAMGFRQFLLRGKSKVELEWTLVTLSYNIKRLFHLGAQLKAA
jgi:transposase